MEGQNCVHKPRKEELSGKKEGKEEEKRGRIRMKERWVNRTAYMKHRKGTRKEGRQEEGKGK